MKKGFTLIELLAVILILGIIALIAIPTVTDIIEDSKKGALKSSANNLLRAAEQQCNIERMKGNSITNTYVITDGNASSELNIKNLPDSGTINVDNDCNATVAIVEGNYCAVSNSDGVTVNTNTSHCSNEEIVPVQTPESCFTFDSATGTITGYNSDDVNCGSAIIIPSTIGESNVTDIGIMAFYNKGLEAVTIPNSVTNIRDAAFTYNNLTSVTIPNSVTSIGEAAFAKNYLTSIAIPSSVTTIHLQAFAYNNLTAIALPSSITTIEDATFAYNNLANISIPSSVTSISSGAFAYNNLTSLTIPSTVTNIESSAFNNNKLPDNQAFIYKRNNDGSIDNTTIVSYGGVKRNNVVIPNNVTNIGDGAFMQINLTSITIPNTVTTIGYDSFAYNDLTSITIPSSVTNIGPWAFSENRLTSLTIPSSVTTIEYGAFNVNDLPDSQAFIYKRNNDGSIDNTTLVSYGGAKRDNVVIPSSVTTLEYGAFGYNGLTSVTIPNSVTFIGPGAFFYNELTSIIIPNSVTHICQQAFYYNRLTNITIGSGITSIDEDAFLDNSDGTITINRLANTVSGAPWGATNFTINWTGTN